MGAECIVSHISTKDMNEEIEKRLRTSRNERETGPCLDWERDTMMGSILWRAKDQGVKGQ